MKRALDVITGIAELRRGMQRLGSALNAGPKQLAEPPKAVVKGETQDGGMTVKTFTVRTIEERVGFIVKMIQKGRDHPAVRKFTAHAVSKKCQGKWCVDEGDYENEIRAVFNTVRENVRYVRDTHGKDLFQHPARTLEFRSADCDDYSSLLCACLQSIGYPVRLRVIRTKTASDWNHIYALVGLPPRNPTKWIPLDASLPKPAGWEAPASMVADKRDFRVP